MLAAAVAYFQVLRAEGLDVEIVREGGRPAEKDRDEQRLGGSTQSSAEHPQPSAVDTVGDHSPGQHPDQQRDRPAHSDDASDGEGPGHGEGDERVGELPDP